MTRLSLPLYKKNISLHWEIIIIVLVFQFKLQEYLPIALVAFTTISSTVVKSDILSTKDGFVILKLKAKKAKILKLYNEQVRTKLINQAGTKCKKTGASFLD